MQAACFRGEIVSSGIGASHDCRELEQRRVMQRVFLEERIEAA